MKQFRFTLLAASLTLLFVTSSCEESQNNSDRLAALISAHENYNSYDHKEYKLGLYTPERYAKDAVFADSLLLELKA